MKVIYALALLIIFLVSGRAAANHIPAKDTLYILLKSDNCYRNYIEASVDSLSFNISGFVRDNKPKDWLDSAGFRLLYVHLQKEPLQVCDVHSCRQYVQRKMISLYDLRDTLKNYVMVSPSRREPVFDASPLFNRKIVILVTESDDKYYLRRVKWFIGFGRLTD